MLEEFELNEDQLRWHRHRDWGHQMTRERAAEIANDKWLPPGLISIDWIALLPPVAAVARVRPPRRKEQIGAWGKTRGTLCRALYRPDHFCDLQCAEGLDSAVLRYRALT